MRFIAPLVGFFFALSCASGSAEEVSADVQVIAFPALLWQDDTGRLKMDIHVWVFEPDDGTIRSAIGGELLEEIAEEGEEDPRVRQDVLRWFFVDNERGVRLRAEIGGSSVLLPETEPNGHARTTIEISPPMTTTSWNAGPEAPASIIRVEGPFRSSATSMIR